jgi:hypothetical protein
MATWKCETVVPLVMDGHGRSALADKEPGSVAHRRKDVIRRDSLTIEELLVKLAASNQHGWLRLDRRPKAREPIALTTSWVLRVLTRTLRDTVTSPPL